MRKILQGKRKPRGFEIDDGGVWEKDKRTTKILNGRNTRCQCREQTKPEENSRD